MLIVIGLVKKTPNSKIWCNKRCWLLIRPSLALGCSAQRLLRQIEEKSV